VSSVIGDRRLALRAGRADPPWSGSNVHWTQEVLAVPNDSAIPLAGQVVKHVGGRDVEVVNGTAIGWIGSSFPFWQEYQLAIAVSPGPDGSVCFTCCSRLRWTAIWAGAASLGPQSEKLAEALRTEVRRSVPLQ
jgi:hypothetical protein